MRAKLGDNCGRILVREYSEHDVLRTVIRKQSGQGSRRFDIMCTVKPGFDAVRQWPVGQPLKTRRPLRRTEAAQERGAADRQCVLRLQHLPGEIRIADLMVAQEG